MDIHLPECPDCGGDMMGFRHPQRNEVLVWACRNCGATFVYGADYRLQPLPIAFDVEDEGQRTKDEGEE